MIWIDFDDIWQKYSEDCRIEFACLSCHVAMLVITLSSLKLHTANNACMLCASVSYWGRLFLQQLRRRTLWMIRETDDDRWIPASREISLTVPWLWGLSSWLSNSDSTVSTFLSLCVCRCPGAFRLFRTSPAACWYCSSSNRCSETLLWTAKRCNRYILADFWLKFCLLYWAASKLPRLLDTCQNSRYFRCPIWKTKCW